MECTGVVKPGTYVTHAKRSRSCPTRGAGPIIPAGAGLGLTYLNGTNTSGPNQQIQTEFAARSCKLNSLASISIHITYSSSRLKWESSVVLSIMSTPNDDALPSRERSPVPSTDDAYNIPQELYDKACEHQDLLTAEERQLLRSRGDTVGKALADPTSLTDVERYDLLHFPPPDIVYAGIQQVTNGALRTAEELWDKARLARSHGNLADLSVSEIELLANNFHTLDDFQMIKSAYKLHGSRWIFDDSFGRDWNAPGNKAAHKLLFPDYWDLLRSVADCWIGWRANKSARMEYSFEARLGLVSLSSMRGVKGQGRDSANKDAGYLNTPAKGPLSDVPEASNMVPIPISYREFGEPLSSRYSRKDSHQGLNQRHGRDKMSESEAASYGYAGRPWPMGFTFTPTPFKLFCYEMNAVLGRDVKVPVQRPKEAWDALSDDERASFKLRLEAMRQDAWDAADRLRPED